YDDPALVLGNRRAFLDGNDVADLELVGFVVRLVLLRPANGLLKEGMRKAAFDANDNGLVVLVADYGALQNAFRHILLPLSLGFCRLLAGNGLNARDVLANFVDARGLLELAGRLLEAQIELLFLQLGKL